MLAVPFGRGAPLPLLRGVIDFAVWMSPNSARQNRTVGRDASAARSDVLSSHLVQMLLAGREGESICKTTCAKRQSDVNLDESTSPNACRRGNARAWRTTCTYSTGTSCLARGTTSEPWRISACAPPPTPSSCCACSPRSRPPRCCSTWAASSQVPCPMPYRHEHWSFLQFVKLSETCLHAVTT